MTITIDQFVSREIHYCASHLISEITKMHGGTISHAGGLQDQAFELYQGQPDYEEAAIQDGWTLKDGEWLLTCKDGEIFSHDTAQEVCETNDIEPHYPEILEHWIVSDWLADKLIAKNETVDKDFAGLTIWGRGTSGQGIAQDYVIQQIYGELINGNS